jgi:hypothetical protein
MSTDNNNCDPTRTLEHKVHSAPPTPRAICCTVTSSATVPSVSLINDIIIHSTTAATTAAAVIALAWSDYCNVVAVAATTSPGPGHPELTRRLYHHRIHLCKLLQRWPWARSPACRGTCTVLIRRTCIAGAVSPSSPFLHLLTLLFPYWHDSTAFSRGHSRRAHSFQASLCRTLSLIVCSIMSMKYVFSRLFPIKVDSL